VNLVEIVRTRQVVIQEDVNELTATDRGIIALLQIDGRLPFNSMSARLGVSEATAQRRTQQLIDAGYFKIIGVVDPLRSPRGQAVLIGLGAETAQIHAIAATVASIPDVRFVSLVTGTFDVVCEVVTPDRATLLRTVTERLPDIDGIRSVNTSWVLGNYKTNYLWDRASIEGMMVEGDSLNPESVPATPGASAGDNPFDVDQLDQLDQAIVRVLQQNGRASYAELAAQLDTTESTARRRTLRLLNSGYLRVVAVGNPFRLGFQDVVFLWIKADLARAHAVVAQLAQYPAVRYLSRVAGAADIVAEALFPNRAALLAFIDGPLATIEGIREVAVSFELIIHKRAYMRFD
jgi:DNA-binding Lrp family transcriptional regulator